MTLDDLELYKFISQNFASVPVYHYIVLPFNVLSLTFCDFHCTCFAIYNSKKEFSAIICDGSVVIKNCWHMSARAYFSVQLMTNCAVVT